MNTTKLSPKTLAELLRYDAKRQALFWKPRGEYYFRDGHNTAKTNMRIWNERYGGKRVHVNPETGRFCLLNKRISANKVIRALGYKTTKHTNTSEKQMQMQFLSEEQMRCADIPGVYWNPDREKYRAQIYIDGRVKHLGSHLTIELATAARKQAEIEYRVAA